MSASEKGSLEQLVEVIEAGQTVALTMPDSDAAWRLVANVRNRLYRARQKLQSICDASFDPFSFTVLPVYAQYEEGSGQYVTGYEVTFKLRTETKQSMYEWRVVE